MHKSIAVCALCMSWLVLTMGYCRCIFHIIQCVFQIMMMSREPHWESWRCYGLWSRRILSNWKKLSGKEGSSIWYLNMWTRYALCSFQCPISSQPPLATVNASPPFRLQVYPSPIQTLLPAFSVNIGPIYHWFYCVSNACLVLQHSSGPFCTSSPQQLIPFIVSCFRVMSGMSMCATMKWCLQENYYKSMELINGWFWVNASKYD